MIWISGSTVVQELSYFSEPTSWKLCCNARYELEVPASRWR